VSAAAACEVRNGEDEPAVSSTLRPSFAREGGHHGRAAGLVGIAAKTLCRKIQDYGFERPQQARGA